MFGDVLLAIAILMILHAAFSTYEHLSLLKAAGRPEGSLPADIVVETLLALVLGIVAAAIRSPELKEITWRSEMKKRPLDELDPRLSFTNFAQRAGLLDADSSSKS
ncbi:magnesium transporter [Irpex rosettiformis]|uniref:Magnesium transporter n=1 Tax=Irpex rosettiformis TaxID=378272 RepID=A0ACB8TPT6_9APHY|nr:magnesium transporter [Irpex rosettiformis]